MGLSLTVCALVFFALLRGALFAEVQASLDGDGDDLEARVTSLPAITEVDDDRFFQVISPSGAVLAASDSAPDGVLRIPETEDGVVLQLPDDDDDYLVMSEQADGGQLIVVGRTIEDIKDTLSAVATTLAGMVPLLTVLVAGSTWLVVGRSLIPVDRMRREVDEVTARNLHRRVIDPGGSDELSQLARTMNNMLDRLESSQQSQRRFISDASHELKSPLASLHQYAEVARTHPDRISAADLAGAIEDEGGRLERLVAGMLVLARADEQSLGLAGVEVDLDDLLLDEVRRLRQSTHLTINASDLGAARVVGDPILLTQLVRNLVDNAAQHASTRVALRLAVVGGKAVLAVEDDGPGIPEADRERVFDRFARLDEARARNSGGSGLGLAIVREIVGAHCGTVLITGSELGGTRIEVSLPAAG